MPQYFKRNVHRIQITHALQTMSLSFISVYIPIYLLTHGFHLTSVIEFFIVFHLAGLIFALTLSPMLIRKFGPLAAFRLHFVSQFLYLLALYNLSAARPELLWVTAILGGIDTMLYWMPLNMLLFDHSEHETMGTDIGRFFALSQLLSIVGPALSALLATKFGFLPVFTIAIGGSLLSYIPLIRLRGIKARRLDFRVADIWPKLRKRKLLFLLEGLENVMEEFEWAWPIIFYITIGTLATPGIVGSLEAIGGAAFTFFIGKHANKNPQRLIVISTLGLTLVWLARIFIAQQLPAYAISVVSSLLLSMLMISYLSAIYRLVKDRDQHEFQVVREIPTVAGRMVLFIGLLVAIWLNNLHLAFILPASVALLLMALFLIKKQQLR